MNFTDELLVDEEIKIITKEGTASKRKGKTALSYINIFENM
jgi:hypothetical protein